MRGGYQHAYTKRELIKILKDFYKQYGQSPSSYDIKMNIIPAKSAFVRLFGNLKNAVREAGLPEFKRKVKPKRTEAEKRYKDPVPVPEGTEQVLMGNEVFLYKDKAPFPASGYSFKGALQLNHIEDRIKCHECGRWYKTLTSHIRSKVHNGMTTSEYKEKHGLSKRTALCCEGTRGKWIKHGKNIYPSALGDWIKNASEDELKKQRAQAAKSGCGRRKRTMEQMNLDDGCPDQLLDKMYKAYEKIGRTPTKAELLENGVKPENVRFIFGSLANAFRILNLQPNFGAVGYSKEQLLQMLSAFYKEYGRPPSYSDIRRGLLPSLKVFNRNFGTLREALKQAQLPYREGPQVRDNAGRFQ